MAPPTRKAARPRVGPAAAIGAAAKLPEATTRRSAAAGNEIPADEHARQGTSTVTSTRAKSRRVSVQGSPAAASTEPPHAGGAGPELEVGGEWQTVRNKRGRRSAVKAHAHAGAAVGPALQSVPGNAAAGEPPTPARGPRPVSTPTPLQAPAATVTQQQVHRRSSPRQTTPGTKQLAQAATPVATKPFPWLNDECVVAESVPGRRPTLRGYKCSLYCTGQLCDGARNSETRAYHRCTAGPGMMVESTPGVQQDVKTIRPSPIGDKHFRQARHQTSNKDCNYTLAPQLDVSHTAECMQLAFDLNLSVDELAMGRRACRHCIAEAEKISRFVFELRERGVTNHGRCRHFLAAHSVSFGSIAYIIHKVERPAEK